MSVRTDHGGEEDDGSEENVPLHVEGFMREEILLDYLWGPTSSLEVGKTF
jgi:hypothetical protein